MAEKICLDERLLKSNILLARRELKMPRYDIYSQLIKDVPTLEETAACNSLETFIGTYKTFKETVSGNGFSADYETKEMFINIFSLYAAAVEASTIVENFSKDEKRTLKQPITFNRGEHGLIDELVKSFIDYAKKPLSGCNIADIAKAYYSNIIEETTRASKNPVYKELVEHAERLHIQVNGNVINGFNYVEEDRNRFFSNITENDIVGNSGMKKALKKAIHNIMKYSVKEKRNVVNEFFGGFTKTFCFYGKPGCGKTATIEAMIGYASSLAEKHSKQLYMRNITNAIKSEYYSKSARNIRDVFSEVNKGEGIYVVVCEDIDTVFFQRSRANDNTQDISNLGELINALEGLTSIDRGNYIFIATTNIIPNMDYALISRFECITEVKGPETEQDYAELFRIKLRNGIKNNYITLNCWNELGRMCLRNNLSGRAVKDISKQIMETASDFEEPDCVFKSSMSVEEQYKALKPLYRKIDDSTVLRKINSYIANSKEAQKI